MWHLNNSKYYNDDCAGLVCSTRFINYESNTKIRLEYFALIITFARINDQKRLIKLLLVADADEKNYTVLQSASKGMHLVQKNDSDKTEYNH